MVSFLDWDKRMSPVEIAMNCGLVLLIAGLAGFLAAITVGFISMRSDVMPVIWVSTWLMCAGTIVMLAATVYQILEDAVGKVYAWVVLSVLATLTCPVLLAYLNSPNKSVLYALESLVRTYILPALLSLAFIVLLGQKKQEEV